MLENIMIGEDFQPPSAGLMHIKKAALVAAGSNCRIYPAKNIGLSELYFRINELSL